MMAAVYHGIGDIRVEEVPTPEIGRDEALLKVKVAAICGTDMRIYKSGHFKIPAGTTRILSHEIAGEIVEVGSQVEGIKPGMRVSLIPNVGCGKCRMCLQGYNQLCPDYEAFGISYDGGFAEYVRIPQDAIRGGNVVNIPDDVSYEAAALNEPLSCCYNGFESCRVKRGELVVILGSGPIGIMHLLLAKLGGAGKVIMSDPSDIRLRICKEFGPDVVVNPQREGLSETVARESNGIGADVVIVACSSSEAQASSLEIAAIRGRINFFGGLSEDTPRPIIDTNLIHYREVTITGSTGSTIKQYKKTMDIIAAKKINLVPLISRKFPLKAIKNAFELYRKGEDLKILIYP